MSSIIKFLKTRDVKSPSRANKYDAGIDFYVPELTDEFVAVLREKNPHIDVWEHSEMGRHIPLSPHQRILIPSGIYCQMEKPGTALIAANKSGVATKTGLIFGAQVVDFEYQGEIHLSLINTSDIAVEITSGMKIIQFLEMPVFNSIILVNEEGISVKDFYSKETTRGASGFGDSDKK